MIAGRNETADRVRFPGPMRLGPECGCMSGSGYWRVKKPASESMSQCDSAAGRKMISMASDGK